MLSLAGCGDSMMNMPPPEPPLNERLVGTWNSQGCENAGSFMTLTLYVKRSDSDSVED